MANKYPMGVTQLASDIEGVDVNRRSQAANRVSGIAQKLFGPAKGRRAFTKTQADKVRKVYTERYGDKPAGDKTYPSTSKKSKKAA